MGKSTAVVHFLELILSQTWGGCSKSSGLLLDSCKGISNLFCFNIAQVIILRRIMLVQVHSSWWSNTLTTIIKITYYIIKSLCIFCETINNSLINVLLKALPKLWFWTGPFGSEEYWVHLLWLFFWIVRQWWGEGPALYVIWTENGCVTFCVFFQHACGEKAAFPFVA